MKRLFAVTLGLGLLGASGALACPAHPSHTADAKPVTTADNGNDDTSKQPVAEKKS